MTLNSVESELVRIVVGDPSEFQDRLGPVPNERIDEAEAELGLKFPTSYRAFLRVYGAGSVFGYEFYGLPKIRSSGRAPSSHPHVVDDTKRTWSYPHPYPRSWIAITDDGGDFTYHIDTIIRDQRGECPIIVNGPGHAGQVVASDFLHFLRRLAAQEILF